MSCGPCSFNVLSLQNAMFFPLLRDTLRYTQLHPSQQLSQFVKYALRRLLAYGRGPRRPSRGGCRHFPGALNKWGRPVILGHGIDVADLGRVEVLLTKMAEDFLLSTFTAAERETECLPLERVPFFAGRLAAKEAVVKALGTGFTGGVAWRHVEIIRLPDGRPEVRLHGAAKEVAEKLGVGRWFISISHTEHIAIAS